MPVEIVVALIGVVGTIMVALIEVTRRQNGLTVYLPMFGKFNTVSFIGKEL